MWYLPLDYPPMLPRWSDTTAGSLIKKGEKRTANPA
jgi:hypothetical protein